MIEASTLIRESRGSSGESWTKVATGDLHGSEEPEGDESGGKSSIGTIADMARMMLSGSLGSIPIPSLTGLVAVGRLEGMHRQTCLSS